MSYVLDALKRADAERERGAVPGLHAQPVPLLPADADAPRAGRPWLWLGAGLAIGLLTMFAWLVAERENAPPPVAVAPRPTPTPTPTPPAVAPAPIAPPPITRLPAVAAATAARPAPKPADPMASAVAESRMLTLQELPDSVRRELPTLTIGGSIYSNDPAQRFLVINGRVVHEKEEIAPDLTLEQIRLKAAVLKYKGYRYTVSF